MPRYIDIFSENAQFQLFETLRRNRKKRQKTGLFLVEGVRNINAAIRHGWGVDAFIHDMERALSDWASGLISGNTTPTVYRLAPQLMDSLSARDETSELLALCHMRPSDDAPRPTDSLVVVFDRPSNKGNLGTMIRSCEAMGADLLAVTGHAVDLYDPEVVTAGMGSFFRLRTARLPGGKPLEDWLLHARDSIGMQIVGTSAHAAKLLPEIDFTKPTLLLIGNETDGLSRALCEVCGEMGRIPFASGCDATSLNVACAATVCLYEVDRQRRGDGETGERGNDEGLRRPAFLKESGAKNFNWGTTGE